MNRLRSGGAGALGALMVAIACGAAHAQAAVAYDCKAVSPAPAERIRIEIGLNLYREWIPAQSKWTGNLCDLEEYDCGPTSSQYRIEFRSRSSRTRLAFDRREKLLHRRVWSAPAPGAEPGDYVEDMDLSRAYSCRKLGAATAERW
jgi:hypothetical protein